MCTSTGGGTCVGNDQYDKFMSCLVFRPSGIWVVKGKYKLIPYVAIYSKYFMY